MTFVHPAWPLPLWAAAAVWLRRRRRGRAARLGFRAAAASAAGGRVFAAQVALCALGLGLGVVALARPQWGVRDETVVSSTRNLLLVVDVSRSMLARDVRPSRLERAKADLLELTDALQGERVGLMAFRNDARLVCPLTTDVGFLREALEGLSIDSAKRGETDVGRALEAAVAEFRDLGSDHNAIILVSDGEDLTGRARELARVCGEKKIPVFCVGVGEPLGAEIPHEGSSDGRLSYRGSPVMTRMDAGTLTEIASASGGVYLPLAGASDGRTTLGSIYRDHVRSLVAQETSERIESRRIERYQPFLGASVVLLVLALSLSLGRPARARREPLPPRPRVVPVAPRPTAVLALLFGLTATVLRAAPAAGSLTADTNALAEIRSASQPRREFAREAQRAWARGAFEEADDLYAEALASGGDNPELERDVRYNGALAALAAGRFERAAERFRDLEGGDAALGLGLALWRSAAPDGDLSTNRTARIEELDRRIGLLEQSAAAFRDAVRLLPQDAAARTNLASVLARIPPLRESLRRDRLDERFEGKKTAEIFEELLRDQRAVLGDALSAFQDETPARIGHLEDLAGRQSAVADAWPYLLERFDTVLPDAGLSAPLREAADGAAAAGVDLESLSETAIPRLRTSEEGVFGLSPLFSDPLALLRLTLSCQSNALVRTENPLAIRSAVAEQGCAEAFFLDASARTGAWLAGTPANDPAAPVRQALETADPPPPQLSDEERDEVSRLFGETLGLHRRIRQALAAAPNAVLLPADRLPDAERACDTIRRILEILDKNDSNQNQQNQNQQDQNQDQQDQQNQQDQNQQDQNQDRQQNQDQQGQDQQDQNQQDQKQDQDRQNDASDSQRSQDKTENGNENEDKDKEGEERESPPPPAPTPDETAAQELMRRILEQEKERAEERRARLREIPVAPNQRDW